MKQAIMSLLKFNVIVGLLFSIFVFIVGTLYLHENLFVTVIGLIGFCYWVYGNISILVRNHKEMRNSIKEAALNTAASAIRFKEEAAERAKNK